MCLFTGSHWLQEYVSVSFSTDGKYVAAQGGVPEWNLMLWIWEKSKLVASVRTVTHPGHAVHQCLIQPGAGVRSQAACCFIALCCR